MTEERLTLTDTELDEVSGGKPNIGGYTYCNVPGRPEGLYAGGCGTSFWGAVAAGIKFGAGS